MDALMFFDYKQIEPRLLAYYLHTIGDDSLVDELNKGTDTYSAIIAPLYGKAPSDLTDEERQEGKTTYLSLSYGAGIWKLATTLDVDMRTARDISDDFWRAWPGIKVLMEIINQRVDKRGYIHTLYGCHAGEAEDRGRFARSR
ncbi:MAG TPA: DNA polymerase, partial [Candidatus Paceibacterota bacterium]